jgi:uncharacterized membrane protein YeaQ/YmgE (transglycosylase-associated protein family)
MSQIVYIWIGCLVLSVIAGYIKAWIYNSDVKGSIIACLIAGVIVAILATYRNL